MSSKNTWNGKERRIRSRRQLDQELLGNSRIDFHSFERRSKSWWEVVLPERLMIRRLVDRTVLEIIKIHNDEWFPIMKGRRHSDRLGDRVISDGWTMSVIKAQNQGDSPQT